MFKRLVLVAGLLAITAAPLSAQSRGRSGLRPLAPRANLLIDIDEVRNELGVEQPVASLLDELQADLNAQRSQIIFRSRSRPNQGEDFEEQLRARFAQISQELRAFDRRSEEFIDVVLEPDQANRLRQLRLQQENGRALVRGDVARELSLSEEQRGQIREIREKSRRSQNELTGPSRKLREQENAELLSVLTEEQKEKWAKLKGEPFEFPTARPFGNRFRRPDQEE